LLLEKEVVYFLTLCVKDRRAVLANETAVAALRTAVARLEHWWVYAAILMPDHVHVLAAPDDREAAVGNLSGALKWWMRMEVCRASAPLAQWEWQPGSFDRLLRSEESAQAKWEYMRENPVRAGLVRQWEDWPYSIGFRERQL